MPKIRIIEVPADFIQPEMRGALIGTVVHAVATPDGEHYRLDVDALIGALLRANQPAKDEAIMLLEENCRDKYADFPQACCELINE